MIMLESRRSFLLGFASTLIAAPAIVRPSSIMAISGKLLVLEQPFTFIAEHAGAFPSEYAGVLDLAYASPLSLRVRRAAPELGCHRTQGSGE